MTVQAFRDKDKPLTIDLHNKIDPVTGVRYLGHAWCDLWSGKWFCMADIGALAVVEIKPVEDPGPSPSDPKETLLP